MKPARFAFPVIAIVFLGLAFSGQEIKTENGVMVITNPEKPVLIGGKSVQLTLKENLRIGDKADEKDILFADIRTARVDTEGRIIVLDWKDFKIKIFDNKGPFPDARKQHPRFRSGEQTTGPLYSRRQRPERDTLGETVSGPCPDRRRGKHLDDHHDKG